MPSSTLTAKGQTTIPKEVREHLQLEPGDQLDFVIEQDGRVVLRPATVDLLSLAGQLLPGRRGRVSDEEMKRVIRTRAARGQ